MAKEFATIGNLTLFKELLQSDYEGKISTAEARSLHSVSIEDNTLKFYREEEPVGTATPAYSITLPETDISGLLEKLTGATGGKVAATKADGTIEESTVSVGNIALKSELKDIATSGNAEDVDYDNGTSGLTATDVQAAIDELAGQSAGGVASKTVYLKDESEGQSEYAKVYKLYQGADASDMTKNTAVGTINIPKDMVVQSGSVVKNPEGQEPGTYIRLVIQNQTDPLFINVADLVDAYTAAEDAAEVQIAISDANVVSATIVAVDGSKITEGTISEAKLSQAVRDKLNADTGVTAVAEGTSNGTVAVTTNGTTADVPVHGLGSAAYAATTDFDAANAAATAKSEVIGAETDSSSNNTIYGAKAYAKAYSDGLAGNYATAAQGAKADTALQPDDIEEIPEQSIRNLFSSTGA